MKRFCALVFCTLFNAACFVFGWHLILNGCSSTFLFYIAPVLSASIFLLFGNLFYKFFRLNRTGLWITMNFMGEYLGWTGLSFMTEEAPPLLHNFFDLFYIIFLRFIVFAIVWGVIWGVSVLSRRLKQQGINCAELLLKGTGMAFCCLSVLMMGHSYILQGQPNGDYKGALILFISGLYLIGYVFFRLYQMEKQRLKVE